MIYWQIILLLLHFPEIMNVRSTQLSRETTKWKMGKVKLFSTEAFLWTIDLISHPKFLKSMYMANLGITKMDKIEWVYSLNVYTYILLLYFAINDQMIRQILLHKWNCFYRCLMFADQKRAYDNHPMPKRLDTL